MSYDPLGRLWRVQYGATDTRYIYDGTNLASVYNGSTYAADWMFGAGVNEPIAAVATGSTPSGWLHADERGSIIARAGATGGNNAIQSYDEYGVGGSSNVTGFRFTGQLYLPSVGLHYFNARMYSPTLGRFLQTDPIGPADDANLYAYAGNDPVNNVDPLGLASLEELGHVRPTCRDSDVCITAPRLPSPEIVSTAGVPPTRGNPTLNGGGGGGAPIVITAKKLKPKFCSNRLYEASSKIDEYAGYGQLIALTGVGLANSEFDPLQRFLLRRGAWNLYGYLGAARALATVGKIAGGDRMSLAEFASTLVGAISGVDKAGRAFGDIGQDLALKFARPNPCLGG